MRGNVLAVAGLAMAFASVASANDEEAVEEEAVEKVVRDAYVKGVHVDRGVAAMRRGFHPDFKMLLLRDGELQTWTLDEWTARVEKAAKDTSSARPEIVARFTDIAVVGTAASVRLEIHRAGRHLYTDFLSLYEFPDGWEIVGKTFYKLPKE